MSFLSGLQQLFTFGDGGLEMLDIKRSPQCFDCGKEFSPKRKALGYKHCLQCGDNYASKEAARKSKCVAPAFNKGAYQYIGSLEQAKCVGR